MDYSYLLIPEDNLKALIQAQNAAGNTSALLKGAEPYEVLAAKAIFNQQPGSDGGLVSLTGTANQITVTGTTTPVLSIPAAFTAPGSITATTSVTATTRFVAGDGTAAAPSVSFAADTDTGFYRLSSNAIGFAAGGAQSFVVAPNGQLYGAASNYLLMPSTGAISLIATGTNQNITLTPSGTGMIDGVFASNGISGIRVSNTNGGASAYAVGYFGTTATPTDVVIGCVGTGNSAYGGANSGFVGTNGNKAFAFLTNGAEVARFHANGRLGLGTGATDSANGILQLATHTASTGGIGFGTTGSLYSQSTSVIAYVGAADSCFRVVRSTSDDSYIGLTSTATAATIDVAYGGTGSYRSLVFKTSNTVALTIDTSVNATFAGQVLAGAGFVLGWSGRGNLIAPSDGVITLRNNAGTDFTRLQFGGTTASFPALRRNGTALDAVLADNTGFTAFQAANFTAKSAATAVAAGEVGYGGTTATTVGAAGAASALPLTPTGYIIVNVAGTQMKVPYYAN